jgi:transcriptional regulator with PAS, ATPase and Fis domain
VDIQSIKQRFGIIGTSELLNRAIDIARQVAPTDMNVLINGESGVGKEVFSHIIHQISPRKHNSFIAVNCGAIPEGTIDSELFGHEKGAFTGATDSRKGYFEEVDGGTIFLDEIGELPLETQSRLLRVLETGEYIRVGSSSVKKTSVRVIAATNVDLIEAVSAHKFREDLYYRLSTVPIAIPPLRDRKGDIHILFRKFASDFASKNNIPMLTLEPEAIEVLINAPWPGNVRQLKNIAEQIVLLEKNRVVSAKNLIHYIPTKAPNRLPVLFGGESSTGINERDLLYKVLFEMKKDMNDLKRVVLDLLQNNNVDVSEQNNQDIVEKIIHELGPKGNTPFEPEVPTYKPTPVSYNDEPIYDHEEVEETLSLADHEKELIKKALDKHQGKRKDAAHELGISERTLYRKIKEYDL